MGRGPTHTLGQPASRRLKRRKLERGEWIWGDALPPPPPPPLTPPPGREGTKPIPFPPHSPTPMAFLSLPSPFRPSLTFLPSSFPPSRMDMRLADSILTSEVRPSRALAAEDEG